VQLPLHSLRSTISTSRAPGAHRSPCRHRRLCRAPEARDAASGQPRPIAALGPSLRVAQPAAKRVGEFKISPAYMSVGRSTRVLSNKRWWRRCSNLIRRSNCGRISKVGVPKKEALEYLKSL
jgi:hypothetical protein